MQRIRTVLMSLAIALIGVGVTAGPAAARGNVLPDTTYETIVQVAAELADLNELPESELSTKQRVAEGRAICRTYPVDVPLLKSMRERCLESATRMQLVDSGPRCKSRRACLGLLKRIGTSGERIYRLAAESNRIASETVPEGACRTALVFTSDEMRYERQFNRLETAYMRAGLDGKKRTMKALEKRLKRLNKVKVRSVTQINQQIAAHC